MTTATQAHQRVVGAHGGAPGGRPRPVEMDTRRRGRGAGRTAVRPYNLGGVAT